MVKRIENKKIMFVVVPLLFFLPLLAEGYVPGNTFSRRAILSTAGGVTFSSFLSPLTPPVWAVDEVDKYSGRMGGLLEKVRGNLGNFVDINDGDYILYRNWREKRPHFIG